MVASVLLFLKDMEMEASVKTLFVPVFLLASLEQ